MTYLSLYLFLLLALCLPRGVVCYDLVPVSFFDASSSSLFDAFDEMSRQIQQQHEAMQNAFFLRGNRWMSPFASTPTYEISNDKDHWELSVEVPEGMTQEDLQISFNEQDRLLTIAGQSSRKNEDTGYSYSSQFSRSFTLDPFVQVDQMTAIFKDSKLQIAAPKDVDKMDHAMRTIPILTERPQITADANESNEEVPKPRPPPVVLEEDDEDGVPMPLSNVVQETKKILDTAPDAPPKASTKKNDPFHVKERVELARQRHDLNPNDVLLRRYESPDDDDEQGEEQSFVNAFKQSELRRRRQ